MIILNVLRYILSRIACWKQPGSYVALQLAGEMVLHFIIYFLMIIYCPHYALMVGILLCFPAFQLLIPAGWSHAVLNLADTLAIAFEMFQ